MCMTESNDKFVTDEVFRKKLENVVTGIIREIYTTKEVNASNHLKLRTALLNLGFIIPDKFVWDTLWDEKYALEDKGLAKNDNIFSYYFANRHSIGHIPEWLRYVENKDEAVTHAFLPSKLLAAEWFLNLIDIEELANKLADGLRLQNRNQDLTCVVHNKLGVDFEFDFKLWRREDGTPMHEIYMSSLIFPKPIGVDHEADIEAIYLAQYLTGVLKGYFGYVAGKYK